MFLAKTSGIFWFLHIYGKPQDGWWCLIWFVQTKPSRFFQGWACWSDEDYRKSLQHAHRLNAGKNHDTFSYGILEVLRRTASVKTWGAGSMMLPMIGGGQLEVIVWCVYGVCRCLEKRGCNISSVFVSNEPFLGNVHTSTHTSKNIRHIAT